MAVSEHLRELIEASGLFNSAWYLHHYPDVALSNMEPLEHYLSYGVAMNRDPSPFFSTHSYLERYPDVRLSGMHPLIHFLRHGYKEGRQRVRDPAVERPHTQFGDYLKHAWFNPVVPAPFKPQDKHCFELMRVLSHDLSSKALRLSRPPLVSIIMPTHNRASLLPRAVESVLNQRYSTLELIVIDDGSSDASHDLLQNIEDSRLSIIHNETRQGVSAARNRGLEAAKGHYIAYLDSDNCWQPDFLAAMVGAFTQQPDADALYSAQTLYSSDDTAAFGVRFGAFNLALLQNNNYVDLNCFMHKQDALAGDGFNESMTRLVDWELILRIAQRKCVYSVPILESNYFTEAATNTVTKQENLETNLRILNAQTHASRECSLIRPVRVLLFARNSDRLHSCIASLEDYLDSGLIRLNVIGQKSLATETIPGEASWISWPPQTVNEDVLLLHDNITLEAGCLEILQQTAQAEVKAVMPQKVSDDPVRVRQLPYANPDRPCSITLTDPQQLSKVNLLQGANVYSNYAATDCLYLRAEVWEAAQQHLLPQTEQGSFSELLGDYIQYSLGGQLCYAPHARTNYLIYPTDKPSRF